MSFGATPESPIPHASAYTLEMRWAHIEKHLRSVVEPPRCGHLAASYGGGLITKADIQERWASINELGSGK